MSGFRRTLCAAVGATTLVSVCVAVAATAAAQSPARPYSAAIRSSAPLVQRAAAPANHPPSTRSKGARSRPASGSATSAVVPQITAPSVAPPALGTLRRNFNGVSSRDSEVTNFNAEVRAARPGPVRRQRVRPRSRSTRPTPIYTTRRAAGPRAVQRQRPVQRGRHGVHQRPAVLLRPGDHTVVRDDPVPERRRSPSGRLDIAVNTSGDPTGLVDRSTGSTHDADLASRTARLPLLRRPAAHRHRPDTTSTSRPTSSRSSARSSTAARSTPSPRRIWSPARSTAHFVHFANLTSGGALAGAPSAGADDRARRTPSTS